MARAGLNSLDGRGTCGKPGILSMMIRVVCEVFMRVAAACVPSHVQTTVP